MRRHHVDLEEGTTVGDVYRIDGEHPMIALVDPHSQRLYVAGRAAARVRALLRAEELPESGQWVLRHSQLRGDYIVSPIENLNLGQPLLLGMAVVNEKSICEKTAKGDCSNMYDKHDNFRYSWKAPKDLFQCEWSDSEDCTELWKEETIDVYPKEDCQGNPKTQKKKIAFCTPA